MRSPIVSWLGVLVLPTLVITCAQSTTTEETEEAGAKTSVMAESVGNDALSTAESSYLFAWAADVDQQHSDFVAVIDAQPSSSTYGTVLTTLPVGHAAGAHHTEHRMPRDGQLFLNGFASGRSFVIDLTAPLHPTVAADFQAVDGLSFAHSFERLPNGNVLATFQNSGDGEGTGGLVELDASGELVRSASAGVDAAPAIRPYSVSISATIDRVVSTTASMRDNPMVPDPSHLAHWVQVWRQSDLELLHTVPLPPGPRGDEHFAPAEPRMMADPEAVLVNTFRCGLYQVSGLSSASPTARHVHTFRFTTGAGQNRHCALASVADSFWVQTVPARHGLVVLDLSDPAAPREASALNLGPGNWTHWISREPQGSRLVTTGNDALRFKLAVVKIDSTGTLAVDRTFGDDGFVSFDRDSWPHGTTGPAVPHGVVFSRN